MDAQRKRTCSRCGKRLVRVYYGDPVPRIVKLAEAGRAAIAGCCMPEVEAVKTCPRCGWTLM
ncbi:MAG: hypothetical protein RLZ55_847, partial [Actinomycetota bacterium]